MGRPGVGRGWRPARGGRNGGLSSGPTVRRGLDGGRGRAGTSGTGLPDDPHARTAAVREDQHDQQTLHASPPLGAHRRWPMRGRAGPAALRVNGSQRGAGNHLATVAIGLAPVQQNHCSQRTSWVRCGWNDTTSIVRAKGMHRPSTCRPRPGRMSGATGHVPRPMTPTGRTPVVTSRLPDPVDRDRAMHVFELLTASDRRAGGRPAGAGPVTIRAWLFDAEGEDQEVELVAGRRAGARGGPPAVGRHRRAHDR